MITVKTLMLACAEYMKNPGASLDNPIVFVNNDNEDRATLHTKRAIIPVTKNIQGEIASHMEIRIGRWIKPEEYKENK